ncbi:hypothetical protein H6F43_09390 [Leptolyngbya sp. FACHB-36]|uniref:putative immunity protein n=1 Tax=Leptolyngbya sp. FACHB-36 TaxID=2692808 RepID=UPI00168096F1|nr:hypothetical protein [Leptolyngbya sp. FACHB-36]MBD2020400.1 hypothetical protein [Leptolyngbya sp. FACHB-36]
MRDRRFIATQRGGSLSSTEHRDLISWAADCAERALPLFNEHSLDDRPYDAIERARAWAKGQLSIGDAREAAFAAHDAARSVRNKSTAAAARATGHAVATAHMADHCLQAAAYALKAFQEAGVSIEAERAWQLERLPDNVRELVLSALGLPA